VVYCVQWFCFDMILCVLMYYSCVLLSLFGVLEFKRNDLQFREAFRGFLMDIPTISYSFFYSFIYVTIYCMCLCIYIYMNVYTYRVLYASAIINQLFFCGEAQVNRRSDIIPHRVLVDCWLPSHHLYYLSSHCSECFTVRSYYTCFCLSWSIFGFMVNQLAQTKLAYFTGYPLLI
jgi:hypothetical protein